MRPWRSFRMILHAEYRLTTVFKALHSLIIQIHMRQFDLQDIRKDEECADTVGVYLHVDENGKAHIRMTLGPEVQTLTRAMTAILCKGLEGATPQEILDLPSDFVTRIIGAELVRVRSQTTYYVLTRIKGICKVYLDRQRMAVA